MSDVEAQPADAGLPVAASEAAPVPAGEPERPAFLPKRERRYGAESAVMRVVATCGVVGICVAIAAILGSQDVAPWIIGLVASAVSVLLAAVIWSSRTL